MDRLKKLVVHSGYSLFSDLCRQPSSSNSEMGQSSVSGDLLLTLEDESMIEYTYQQPLNSTWMKASPLSSCGTTDFFAIVLVK